MQLVQLFCVFEQDKQGDEHAKQTCEIDTNPGIQFNKHAELYKL